MTSKLQNKSAIITGGAGGLGLGIALAYVREGANVVLAGRNGETLAIAKTKVEEAGGSCAVVAADLSNSAGATDAIAAAEAAFGTPDILVNSAGTFVWKPFLELSAEDWDTTLSSNLSAAFYATQAFARAVSAKEQAGAVINVSSIHGVVGDGGVVPHCASKFGLIGLTEASAEALRGMGIRVNCLSPGAIEPDSATAISESLKGKVTQGELARLAVFLGSEDSGNLTGANLNAFGITRPVIASR